MLDHFLHSLLPTVQHFQMLGYWMALLETAMGIGLILPGSTFILLLGALAAQGAFDFGDLLWFAVAGAVIGDNLNYYLGAKFGSRWIREGVWFLKPKHLAKAHLFFDAHGAKSVFLGRFIPSVKEVVPFIAGSVGMRQRTFFVWNVLGAVGWGLQWVGAGYLFARFWKTRYVTPAGRHFYVGTVSVQRDFLKGMLHQKTLDADRERDLLVADLKKAKAASTVEKLRLADPALVESFLHGRLFWDGFIAAIALR